DPAVALLVEHDRHLAVERAGGADIAELELLDEGRRIQPGDLENVGALLARAEVEIDRAQGQRAAHERPGAADDREELPFAQGELDLAVQHLDPRIDRADPQSLSGRGGEVDEIAEYD